MLDFLGSLNPYLATILATFIPVIEVQGSVPLALAVYKLSVPVTFALTLLASCLIPLIILPLISQVVHLLKRIHPKVASFIDLFLAARYQQHSKSFNRWGALALAIFVAIPGPFTGGWSASLLAYLFGIPLRLAVLGIAAGSVISILIMVGVTLGGLQLLG